MKHVQDQVAAWRANHAIHACKVTPATVTTRDEARTRISEIEMLLTRRPRPSSATRAALVAEKTELAFGVNSGKYATATAATPSKQPAVSRPGLVPEAPEWLGPRCEFCGGEMHGRACANQSDDWPHPPTVIQ